MATYTPSTYDASLATNGDIINCEYTGSVTSLELSRGTYKLECWGAQGGSAWISSSKIYTGGKGGYSVGIITLKEKSILYIYVGGKGNTASHDAVFSGGGFNGGGNAFGSGNYMGTGGGGASDIRINNDSLYARVIVAGGGGGISGGNSPTSPGGYGGGIEGGQGNSGGGGGTQNSGGEPGGTFGTGAQYSERNYGPGGGGWYGGGYGHYTSGGGGSGFVYNSSTASNYPEGCLLNSSYYLTDISTVAGNSSFPSTSGSSETGHSGNGYIRITIVDVPFPHCFIGINNIAHKVKKIYIGVEGIARKVKKAYIGISEIATLFFTKGRLHYKGTITGLSVGRHAMQAINVGDYGLFAGGNTNSSGYQVGSIKDTVDAYDKSLTRTTPTVTSAKYLFHAATSVGDYGLFGGGLNAQSSLSVTNIVNTYNTSLTRSIPTRLSVARQSLAATLVGDYGLFGGGDIYVSAATQSASSSSNWKSTVDAYDKSLTRTTPTSLSAGRTTLGAVAVDGYGLFAGGCAYYYNGDYYSNVDAYNTSLTRSRPTGLSVARRNIKSISVGNYGLFAGGQRTANSNNSNYNTVDAYNKSLTRTIPTSLSVSGVWSDGTTLDEYGLFSNNKTINIYDTSLTMTIKNDLQYVGSSHSSVTVGSYGLFAGGVADISSVEVYTII